MVLYSLIISPSFLFYYYTIFFNNNHNATIYATAQSSDEFLTDYNAAYGTKIQYPLDWQKMQGPTLDRFRSNNIIPIVAFLPPDNSVRLMVGIEKLQENTTLEQDMNDTISSLQKNQPGFRLIESSKTTLANLPAYKLHYNGLFDVGSSIKRFPVLDELFGDMLDFKPVNASILGYGTIRDGNSYFVGYTDTDGKVNKQLSDTLGDILDPFNTNSLGALKPYASYIVFVSGLTVKGALDAEKSKAVPGILIACVMLLEEPFIIDNTPPLCVTYIAFVFGLTAKSLGVGLIFNLAIKGPFSSMLRLLEFKILSLFEL